jgi:hypothetical protein
VIPVARAFFNSLLGHIANCNYCACMGRVVIPILSLMMAAAVAAIFATIAHDGLGIASGTIRRDALSSAGFILGILAFGYLLRLNR